MGTANEDLEWARREVRKLVARLAAMLRKGHVL